MDKILRIIDDSLECLLFTLLIVYFSVKHDKGVIECLFVAACSMALIVRAISIRY